MKISPQTKRYVATAGTALRLSIQFGFVPLVLYLGFKQGSEGKEPLSWVKVFFIGSTRICRRIFCPYLRAYSFHRPLLNNRQPQSPTNFLFSIMSGFLSSFLSSLVAVLLFLCACFLLLYLRHLYLRRSFRRGPSVRRSSPASVCVVLGSGGHTAEILRLIQSVPVENYSPRFYVLADTDTTSLERLEHAEGRNSKKPGDYKIFRIPRSREVRQSYASSVMSTLVSMLRCAPLVYNLRCDILLCNGPGTCVPVCFFAYVYNLLLFRRCQIIFIESMCRVESLSTTGKMLYYLGIADEVFVQWPQLSKRYRSSIYLGRLV